MNAAAADEEQSFEDLLRVMHRLWRARLELEVKLIATGQTDRSTLDRVLEIRSRIQGHQSAERDAGNPV